MEISYTTNNSGEEQVILTYEDGSQTVMYKWKYDEMIANQQNGTIS